VVVSERFNTRLLAAILATQPEDPAMGTLSEERVRAALTGGPPLTGAERRLIWFSPDARHLFLTVRRAVRMDLKERIRDAGLGHADQRLAASGGEGEEIAGHGFSVTLFNDGVPGSEWSISVQLSAEYLALLPPGTAVELSDSGGAVWASGIPDSLGCISAIWSVADESPRARLQRFSLRLDP
jgi:hypothetical protein